MDAEQEVRGSGRMRRKRPDRHLLYRCWFFNARQWHAWRWLSGRVGVVAVVPSLLLALAGVAQGQPAFAAEPPAGAEWQAASPGATLGLDAALRSLRAGIAERERALDLSAQLEQLDYEELAIWEQLIQTLPIAALAPEARTQESAMRLGTLPLLSARQKEYRALEFELGRGLAGASSASRDPAALGRQMARLASIREWSDLVDQAQRQIRTTLDMTHAVALARAAKSGMRMDAAALSALGQVRERRGRVEAARAEATAAWEAGREVARIEQLQQALGTAAALAQVAMDNERSGDELRKRAADNSLPTSLRDLLRAAAGVLQSTAGAGGRSAADMVGIVDLQAESFLAEPSKVNPADAALTALLAERRQLAKALRASLAARMATLTEAKSLAAQRERVLGGAGYLAPSEDKRRVYALAQRACGEAWQQVDELTAMAGDVTSAESGGRALAAEWLAVKLEQLVLLEERLHTLALGQLLDLTPRPADPRLAGAASAWERDLNALQAVDVRWTAWRKAWNERSQREEGYLAALRSLVSRVNDQWVARVSMLSNATPQTAAKDEISRLTIGMVGSAAAHARSLSGTEPALRRAQEDAEADPVVGAVLKSAGEFRWSQASSGLRDLPRLFEQVARLPGAGRLVPLTLNATLPTQQRLAAAMSLSEALELSWLALRSGEAMQLTTEVAGETYLLEGLGGDTPTLRRQREFLVEAPARMLAVSMRGVQLAQAQASPGRQGSLLMDPTVPLLLGGKNILRTLVSTRRELIENWWVYLSMPFIGAGGGALFGTPAGPVGTGGGATAGFWSGTAAAGVAMAQDAFFGGSKGLVTGLAQDVQLLAPAEYRGVKIHESARSLEKSFPAFVDKLQAAVGLTQIGVRGYTALRQGSIDALRESGRLRQRIDLAQEVLEDRYGQIARLTVQQMGGGRLTAAERAAIDASIRAAEASRAVLRSVIEGYIKDDLARHSPEFLQRVMLKLVAAAAAETLADLNDAAGPDWEIKRDLRGLASDVAFDLVAAILRTGQEAASIPVHEIAQRAVGSVAADPQAERALELNRKGGQERSAESTQRAVASAIGTNRASSSEQLRAAMERDRIIPHEWETKEGLDKLRRMREQEQKEKQQKEKEEKEKKDKDAGTGEIKTPIKPVTPPIEPDPTKTDSAGSEKTGWWGFEAVISYKFKGASCTQTLSGEVFGTRAEAEQAMRDETARAMRADAGNRSEVVPVRQGFYAVLSNRRPTYTGPTGTKAVQCVSVPTTTPAPTAPPAVPSVARYEPKGSGQPCPQLRQQMMDRCSQMEKDAARRNCAATGASGCAVGGPGCGGTFGDYVGWCTLHPSYEPLVTAGLTMFVSEIKACIELFLGDDKPGRQERGIECQVKAQKKLEAKRGAWVQQACLARCAQDGRSGTATLGGGRHMCECR
jgi:hypothetical protein